MSKDEQGSRLQIILAEDHRNVRRLLRTTLEWDGRFEVIAETGDGLEAVALVERLQPDVIILDIRLPGLEGIAATKDIKARSPSTKVIAMSVHDDVAHIYDALAAGADGYVVKSGRDAIAEAVVRVSRGEIYLTPPISLERIESYRQNAGKPSLQILS